MNKDDTVYLRHSLECMRRIEEDIAEGRERFMESHTLQDAVAADAVCRKPRRRRGYLRCGR